MFKCQRCGKPYTQKKNLIKHLNSKKVCETKLCDISRELLLIKVKETKKWPKVAVKKALPKKLPAADLVEKAKVNRLLLYNYKPWDDIEIECSDYQFGANVFEYAAKQLHNLYKNVVYIHPEGDCIEILFKKNHILCFTRDDLVSKLLFPFYDAVRENCKDFDYNCKQKIDKVSGLGPECKMYNAFKKYFTKYHTTAPLIVKYHTNEELF